MHPATLSASLRTGTQASHRRAESAPFVRALFSGHLARDRYVVALRQWHAIYTALEEAQERHGAHATLGAVIDPALFRRQALERDLQFFAQDDAAPAAASLPAGALLPATGRYVRRLRTLALDEPTLLLAHHYTRYLGDLSGGQILRRAVGRAYALGDGAGLDFYDFPGIEDAQDYKADYRSRLDGLDLDAATIQAVVDEANAAFELNRQVFMDLSDEPATAVLGE